ncbi:MAG: DinB family protein, partial [Actinobacteria bacterium]|nr:DinB family protein [Actinomycetota bacterium]
QAPERVAEELAAAAAAFAVHLDTVPDDGWARPGRRSNGSVFTVDTLSRYFLHDVVHHLHDVGA